MCPLPVAVADDDDDEPTASFTVSPSAPLTNETVTFTSTSRANEGRITSQTWDLDNDGAFDDASGATASRSYAAPGSYTVRLRVRNSEGESDTESRTVTVANRPPTASFTFAPIAPLSGDSITFTSTSSDPDGSITSTSWDLDNNGTFDPPAAGPVSRSFAQPGTYTVRLQVRDNRGATSTTSRTIVVGNRAPTASFTVAPVAPLTGETVTFTSNSTDPEGSTLSTSWDLDDNGAFDPPATGPVSRSFAQPGTYTVRLQVRDNRGATSTTSRTIVVGNRAPTASLDFTPLTPHAGETVQLEAAASDPEGQIATVLWDLDADGNHDDASGREAAHTFATPGSYVLSVRVTDAHGATATATRSIEVAAAPRPDPPGPGTGGPSDPGTGGPAGVSPQPFDDPGAPPPDPPLPPAEPDATPVLQLLQPFPLVRIRGRTTGRGARLNLFTVRAPAGAAVLVRCRGRGCPARRTRARVSADGGLLRLRRFERHLRAGVRLEILVTKPGLVGKYTRFRIRRLKPPARVDRCVLPGQSGPSRCPA